MKLVVACSGIEELLGGPMEKRVRFAGNSPSGGDSGASLSSAAYRIFLLSPANLKGVRGQRLLHSRTHSELGDRLRVQGATLAELFCHTSSLYFRGKLAYARFFARTPTGFEGCHIITSSRGLLGPDTVVDMETIQELASGAEIDLEDDRYRIPLLRDAARLETTLPQDCQVVLLGSVATEKYVAPLKEVFGRRLVFPTAFIGRGDMSRGGLLLRSVRENRELAYASAQVHRRKGARN